jgi:hypothetical protein
MRQGMKKKTWRTKYTAMIKSMILPTRRAKVDPATLPKKDLLKLWICWVNISVIWFSLNTLGEQTD